MTQNVCSTPKNSAGRESAADEPSAIEVSAGSRFVDEDYPMVTLVVVRVDGESVFTQGGEFDEEDEVEWCMEYVRGRVAAYNAGKRNRGDIDRGASSDEDDEYRSSWAPTCPKGLRRSRRRHGV